MRPSHLCTATVSLLLVACHPLAAQTLQCARASQPPNIDAKPDDDCWKPAMVATDFSRLSSGGLQRAFRQTTVRAAWDSRALYLHMICLEPDPASITAVVAQRDGATWMEDALEVFLQPDTAKTTYFHFIANAKGVLYDELGTDGAFNAEVTLAAAIEQEAWLVEMAIPWAEMGLEAPQVADEWGFNVGRAHRPKEPTEWSTWAPLEKGQHKFGIPDRFRRLRFVDQPTPGRAPGLQDAGGMIANPDFSDQSDGKPDRWAPRLHSTITEVHPGSMHYKVRNDGDYSAISQALDIPVKAGQVYTVYAVVRGSQNTAAGIAVVQEMEDGRPDDLYPFWKMEVTGRFKLYSGRIVVDKGAKRFKSIGLYRANRAGWVEYAHVQMYPGLHGVSGIMEAERCTRRDERGIGQPWPTPSLRPFKPLPSGPIRALVFVGEFQRDVAELAQRLDIHYDLVYCPTYRGSGKVDGVVAFDADGVLGRLAQGAYDLIILAGRPSEQSVIDGILACVTGGAGLLSIEPLQGGGAAKPEILEQLLNRLPEEPLPDTGLRQLLGALDPDVLTATSKGKAMLKSLAVSDMGQGRIARLTWAEKVPGLVPFAPGECAYFEYRWAALCKAALWAADRAPKEHISRVQCGRDLSITLDSTSTQPLDATVQWDNRLGPAGHVDFTTGPFVGGKATVHIALPPWLHRVKGPSVARVLLSNKEGHGLDMAAVALPAARPRVQLKSIEAPSEATAGQQVAITVAYRAQSGGGLILRAELLDAFGRVVSRQETPCAPGDGKARLKLVVRQPLSVYHRIVASALDGGVTADRVERDLLVPQANATHLDDFALAVGYAAMKVRCPQYLQRYLNAFLKSHGVRACTVNTYMIKDGLYAFGGVSGAGMRTQYEGHVRQRCFSDPAQVEAMKQRVVQNIGKKRPWGFFGYNMDDETHVHQAASTEVCTSEHCAAAFRRWAREHYETIAAVNAQWSTAYAGFDDIEPPLLQDMKDAVNPSRWVDFRLFMERVWANAYASVHEAVRKAYPDVNLSFTNPYKYNSLSGTDFSLWVAHEEVLLRYFHRHVVDRNKSWTDAPMISWFGYRSDARQCGHFVWWFALNGGVVPIWWDPVEPWAYHGKEGFTAWQQYDPLWRPTGRSLAVTRSADDLQKGIGKVLRASHAPDDEALIVHSQPSMHVLYAEAGIEAAGPTQEGYNRYRQSDDAIAAALKRHALAYRYVLPEALTPERLRGVQLVALPSCVALSEGAAETLAAFVRRGGKLLADVMPATHDEHGKPRLESPLVEVFRTDGATCLAEPAGSDSRSAIDEAIYAMGARPAIQWQAADGSLPKYTELYRFAHGEAEYIGIVRAATDEAVQDGPLTLRFSGDRHVYDCREGRLLGRLAELELSVQAGDARFIALMPYRVQGISASCSPEGMTLNVSARVEADARPTNHVLRVEVIPPGEDAPAPWYCWNMPAPRGELRLSIPLALSDPAGVWRVTVRDVASGHRGSARASWAGPQGGS